ncbi:TatD family hydrolase [Mycoplasmopsis gallopavonis]|uniref:TatD DNase family protein n=1 Tax=Mycoplasmopsis gallopavonis TaxID=76629 RepID=A0A449AYN8_9BACT|nr:TatD family hydrolase [Mycoplasmopsis gallopavonis]RIV16608.1 TatD family deoxyribonuclease [Mycoplasmopsis gallopavonis]VEU72614.1 TatD DNase family protein [Mycoplasmopsis gallopavonis]
MGKKRNKFIDAHCHISLDIYKDEAIIEEIMLAALHNKIDFFIVNGGHTKENLYVKELAKKYDLVKPCVGFHPEDKPQGNEGEILESLIDESIVAIGEVGLEYFYDWGSSREQQLASLRSQIQVGIKHDLPIVVHLRDKEDSDQAYQDFYDIMKENPNLRVMLHTFVGTVEWAKKFLEFPNLYLSFSGVSTFGSAENTREVIKITPLDRMLLETDAPFLRVHPYTGEKNEPNTILYVYYYVGGLKGIGMEKFVDRINRNVRNLFRIKD